MDAEHGVARFELKAGRGDHDRSRAVKALPRALREDPRLRGAGFMEGTFFSCFVGQEVKNVD